METLVLVLSASGFHFLRTLSTMAFGHSAASAHPLSGHLTLHIFFGSWRPSTELFTQELIVFMSVGSVRLRKDIVRFSSGTKQGILWRKKVWMVSNSQPMTSLRSSSSWDHLPLIRSTGELVLRSLCTYMKLDWVSESGASVCPD